MFTILLQKQADIFRDLLEFYLPNGGSVIDFTYGTGATWWNTQPGRYKITKTDAAPSTPDTIQKDLTNNDYAALGLHDAGFFDPPYLIGRPNFDYSSNRQGFTGPRSWGSNELLKYMSNPTLEAFNERIQGLNRAAAQTISEGGFLFIKIMDCRYRGKLLTHHITITSLLTNFELVDLAVYIRQGATTWESKTHLQGLHGYWMVFKRVDSENIKQRLINI